MRKQLIIAAGAIIAILVMIAPAIAQVPCGIPGGFGIGGPLGGFGPGIGGCGLGLPFGIGGFGIGMPFGNIVGLGIAMIDSVLSAAFSCIGLGGLGGFGGFGLPFGGCF